MLYLFKKVINPLRSILGKAILDDRNYINSIIYKAANIIAKEKIEGDYLEFGVFTGNSFIQSYNFIKKVFEEQKKYKGIRTEKDLKDIEGIWRKMRFFAFDSFQGLPELRGIDKQTKLFDKGKYACTEGNFKKNLVKAGVPLDKVVTIPGWFEQTCTKETIEKYSMKKAAIIHLDCDLYESTKTVLDFVKPLLIDGTIIIFDDWYLFRGNPNLGEQRAFHEWKKTVEDWTFTEYQKEGPFRNSFIANTIS